MKEGGVETIHLHGTWGSHKMSKGVRRSLESMWMVISRIRVSILIWPKAWASTKFSPISGELREEVYEGGWG